MKQRIEKFRRTLQREMPRRGRGMRFPPALTAEAASIAEEGLRAGWKLAQVARALGVRTVSLRQWCEREHETQRYPGTLQPVAVVPPSWTSAGTGIVVHGPGALEDAVVIGLPRRLRVFAYTAPADMRKGHDSLAALVRHQLGHDPLSGDYYLFLARNRIRAKVLLWDGTGLCVYAKRLERGRFAPLWERAGTGGASGPLPLTVSELALFLEGSQWVGQVPLSPPPFVLAGPRPHKLA
jgi:transposase